MSTSTGARHAGRPGWRYAFIGPTECGKTTTMMRYIRAWMDEFKEGIVYSDFRIFDGTVDPDKEPEKPRIPDPRVRLIKRFDTVRNLRGKRTPVLLAMDEFGKYINSLQGYTSTEILKTQLDLASNLMKQDLELVYTDQWPKNLHTRVRMNVNRVFLPNYEEARGTIEYFTWPTIDEYLARDEIHRTGPSNFIARPWFKYFDTKEIISPKLPKFNPEREVERIQKWVKREKREIPEGRTVTDFLSYYLSKTNQNWGRNQIGAVRFLLQNSNKEEGKKGKEKEKEKEAEK